MHIERIDIQNFKLFDQRSFEFHPRFNLVVGVNGSGKTSMLKATAAVLSAAMSNVSDIYKISDDDIRFSIASIGPRFRFERQYPVSISLVFSGFGDDPDGFLKVERKSEADAGGGGLWSREWNARIKQQFDKIDKGEWATLPIIAFYRCNRLWQGGNSMPTSIEAATRKDSRLDGYSYWHEASADFSAFQAWIIKKTLERLQQVQTAGGYFDAADDFPDSDADELGLVNKAVSSCLENSRRIFYDLGQSTMLVQWQRWITSGCTPFDLLSDGQRTLLAMVADIARRACLLNPHLDSMVLEATPGIVLIDELDLHLHPKWQRRIIGDLRRTFPQIQFICTTHSPQLIGQCKPEEIILLDTPEEPHPGQSYGMDSNWILRHIQDSDDRDPAIEAKLSSIFEAIEEAEFEQAESEIVKLRAEIGEHPDLVEAEALINRYTRFSDDEEQ